MINKLVVLNGTEGHKFEVGKNYVFSDVNQKVKEIRIVGHGYRVLFEDNGYIDVMTNDVLIFKAN